MSTLFGPFGLAAGLSANSVVHMASNVIRICTLSTSCLCLRHLLFSSQLRLAFARRSTIAAASRRVPQPPAYRRLSSEDLTPRSMYSQVTYFCLFRACGLQSTVILQVRQPEPLSFGIRLRTYREAGYRANLSLSLQL